MSGVIDQFLNEATKSAWVNAQRCNIGDTIKITSIPTIDNQTYKGKTYLIMEVVLERTSEPLKLRLSGQQVQNLVSTFGKEAQTWIGKRIKVAGKANYPGLGKEGLIYVPA